MEGAALETNTAPDVSVKPASMACLRRQAWAHSKDSIWQESEPPSTPVPQRSQSTSDPRRTSEEPGQNPNKIASWLIECRTPLGASLDDQSPPPNKGALRNGCSFEDDLSLGAEANHLLSSNNKTESRFSLVADQKRSQYKERGRSMNSTGSGKSSTVSSVSELLDLYEEDPEEILFNLGFGREEPDLNAKIPSRFFNSSSVARGIDIKVYLKAQLQRMEIENPNYALTSRFRQIEVLTTVANEFFQLYSQVSGQPVQRINSKDQDSEGRDEGRSEEKAPVLKKSNSALNVAKLLKKTITKHNLLAASLDSPVQTNGCTAAISNHAVENGLTPPGSEPEGEAPESEPKAEAGGQKLIRKKDNCSLATVTEESGGDGELDLPSDGSPEQSTGVEHQVDSAEFHTLSPISGQAGAQVDQSVSTLEKAPCSLTAPHLAQLRIENTDSFDMEEIQSNEDETLPLRTSRAADLSRTVSQQSDSSGFAEEPSGDSGSSLKVQESSDSCDSETTVTSHPSQDLATPVALDQPGFVLPDTRQTEVDPHNAAEVDGKSNSVEEDQMKLSPGQFPQYTVHHLPKLIPMEQWRDESLDDDSEPKAESEVNQCVSAAEEETLQESEDPRNQFVSEQDPQPTEKLSETVIDTTPSTEGDQEENGDLQESIFLDDNNRFCPPSPSRQVLSALNRAKQGKLSQMGQRIEPEINEMPPSPGKERSQRSTIRLQRSSSLPSSLFSPSRMVSSIKIQVGRGQGACSQARFSVKYTGEDGQEQEVEQEEPPNVLSTLIINPTPSSASNKKTPTSIPPKHIPSHLMRSCCSLQSSSPPPEWTSEDPSWTTRSVPDLSSHQHPFNHSPQLNMSTNQNRKNWNQNFTTLPSQCHSPQCIPPSPSPRFNFSPCAFPQHTQPLHHSQPYSSLPNLFQQQNPSMIPQSGLTGHHTPANLLHPQHQSTSNLHQASNSMLPYNVGPGHPHPGNPMMQSQGYNHPYTNPSPYNTTPLGVQFAPQHLFYQGYVNSFSHPVSQYPQPPPLPQHLKLEHSIYPGLAPSAPGFHPCHGSAYHQGYNFHSGFANPPGLASRPGLSSTEIQLRRVLHEIRATIQSLIENRVNTPDVFIEHQAAHTNLQSLSEFQKKRRSLNLFRSQMMDLEMSIMQQQALVYNQLSPADRREMEKLQSLRASVREELQELEQQLEEKLMDLMHSTQHGGFRTNCSVDNLSTVSALRAMEPMSELLSEQLYLQSELNYDSHESSTYPFSRSSSPLRRRSAGGDGKQKQEVYRTSVDITPSVPSRPNTRTNGNLQQMEEMEKEGDCVGVEEKAAGKGGASEQEEEDGATGEVGLDSFQQLIKEIRESVSQEVRKEIYSELLAAVTMQQSPVSARKHHP